MKKKWLAGSILGLLFASAIVAMDAEDTMEFVRVHKPEKLVDCNWVSVPVQPHERISSLCENNMVKVQLARKDVESLELFLYNSASHKTILLDFNQNQTFRELFDQVRHTRGGVFHLYTRVALPEDTLHIFPRDVLPPNAKILKDRECHWTSAFKDVLLQKRVWLAIAAVTAVGTFIGIWYWQQKGKEVESEDEKDDTSNGQEDEK